MNEIINIKTISLEKGFGSGAVLDGLDMSIRAGSVFGLVGLNGAGKTTLIRLLLGLLKPEKGEVTILNYVPWEHKSEFYRKLGVVLEHDGFLGNLNFIQNLKMFAKAKGVSEDEMNSYLNEFWKDEAIIGSGRKIKFFSRGQRMQCALCRAFMGWPKVCLLDEPAIALDVDAYDHFCGLVKTAKENGASVLISSHQLSTIEELCDTVGLLRDKKLNLINVQGSKGGQSGWLIAAGQDRKYGEIIKNETGSAPLYEDGQWRFFVEDAGSTIPRIVSSLAASGALIHEVKRTGNGLKEAIKRNE